MPKILHTSDVQLDAPFGFLGRQGSRHRQQLRDTFGRIVKLAQEDDFDLFLIAGDLFDSNRPHHETVQFVAAQLGGLEIPVCILPGNHDCYDDSSVFRRTPFPDNVFVFTEQPTAHEFPELDLSVYGNPIRSPHSNLRPLQGLKPTGRTRWHVAMAHGNVVRPDIVDPPRPIGLEEIAASRMDYVALGDWHAFADYSQGPVRAFYSGAPEPTALHQEGAGQVAVVEMDADGVRVRPERVGATSVRNVSIEVTGKDVPQIEEEIRKHADPHLMLRATLSGLADLGALVDTEALQRRLTPDFYHLECEDESHPQLAHISPQDYPEELVIGKFVRLMDKRIEAATDDAERRRAERALQLGIALLQGKEVLR